MRLSLIKSVMIRKEKRKQIDTSLKKTISERHRHREILRQQQQQQQQQHQKQIPAAAETAANNNIYNSTPRTITPSLSATTTTHPLTITNPPTTPIRLLSP
jgi:hypothetical protein